MSNNTNALVALGALFLFGVFIGLLISKSEQQIEFAVLSTEQGIGCRVFSSASLPNK